MLVIPAPDSSWDSMAHCLELGVPRDLKQTVGRKDKIPTQRGHYLPKETPPSMGNTPPTESLGMGWSQSDLIRGKTFTLSSPGPASSIIAPSTSISQPAYGCHPDQSPGSLLSSPLHQLQRWLPSAPFQAVPYTELATQPPGPKGFLENPDSNAAVTTASPDIPISRTRGLRSATPQKCLIYPRNARSLNVPRGRSLCPQCPGGSKC